MLEAYERFSSMAEIHNSNDKKLFGISKNGLLKFMNPPIKDENLASANFRYYDKNKDGLIDFIEYYKSRSFIYSSETKDYYKGK